MTPGRGFTALNMKGERIAFGFWMRDLISQHGGRAAVSEVCGISTDSLSKWAGGRAIPSKINIQKLIDGEIIPFESMDSMLAESPWMDHKYLKRIPKTKAAPKPKVEVEASAEIETWNVIVPEPERHNLMDAVLAEPGLNSTQRAQLAALIAMIVNGVDVQVSITVKP